MKYWNRPMRLIVSPKFPIYNSMDKRWRGWNNRLYEFQQIQPEIILAPKQPTRLNRWLGVWYFVENEDDDQKRFPDNGFIATSHSDGTLPKLNLRSEPLFRGVGNPHLGCGTCVIPTRAHRAQHHWFKTIAIGKTDSGSMICDHFSWIEAEQK